jgi:hypothetical protein
VYAVVLAGRDAPRGEVGVVAEDADVGDLADSWGGSRSFLCEILYSRAASKEKDYPAA